MTEDPKFSRALPLPDDLTAAGYSLRGETAADEAFLERLYISVRWEELAQAPWAEEQKIAFLRWQFSLQRTHYAKFYAATDFGILDHHGEPAGRLYLHRGKREVRIVDISFLPDHRGRGVGGKLLAAVFAEAAVDGRSVTIHVEHFNPARRLYERMGFRELSRDGVYALMEWRDPANTALASSAAGL